MGPLRNPAILKKLLAQAVDSATAGGYKIIGISLKIQTNASRAQDSENSLALGSYVKED